MLLRPTYTRTVWKTTGVLSCTSLSYPCRLSLPLWLKSQLATARRYSTLVGFVLAHLCSAEPEKACLQVVKNDPQTFAKAYQEFTALDMELAAEYRHIKSFCCPACSPHPHAVHVDGNMKLYTQLHDPPLEHWRDSYFQDGRWLFVPDAVVKQHERLTDIALGHQVCLHPQLQAQLTCNSAE